MAVPTSDKPSIIVDLEKILNTEFTISIDTENLYFTLVSLPVAEYSLNSKKEVIGLRIQFQNISNLNFLSDKRLQKLQVLNLSNNNIENIENITILENLRGLNLEKNKIKNIQPISKLKSLIWLNLNYNNFDDKKLEFLPNLQKIEIQNCNLKTLNLIEGQENLIEIKISYNNITNIDNIVNFKKLKNFYASDNKLKKVPELNILQNLKIVDLSNNQLTEFPKIEKLSNFTLYIRNNQIEYIPEEELDAVIDSTGNPIKNLYIFKEPSKSALNAELLATIFKEAIESISGEQGSMFGIFGQWGRGKTFFWNILKNKLLQNANKKQKYHIIEISAWKYNDTKAIWAYIFEKIAAELFKKPQTNNKFLFAKYIFKRFWYNFSHKTEQYLWKTILLILLPISLLLIYIFFPKDSSFNILKNTGLIGIIISYFLFIVDYFTKISKLNITNIMKDMFSETIESLLGIQAQIEKELLELMNSWKKAKIILFVDDLDRCNEENILNFIDSLKIVNQNQYIAERIKIIAAIDERILINVVKNKYKNLVSEKDLEKFVREYLEKIFIFGIKLAPLTEIDKEQIFNNFTKKHQQYIFGKKIEYKKYEYSKEEKLREEDLDMFKKIIINYELTPRQIRNIFNRYILALQILKSSVKGFEIDEKIIKEILIYLVTEFSLSFQRTPFYEKIYTTSDEMVSLKINNEEIKLSISDYKKLINCIEQATPF